MRQVNNTLFERLKDRAVAFASCWLVTRVDGVQIGFTSHDMPVVFEGVTYNPSNGMSSDAVQEKNDFSTNNSSAKIVFSNDVSEHDVRAGRFDGAAVRNFWIDPDHPEYGSIPILRGFIGEVTLRNGEWEAEVRSLLDYLQLPFGRQYNLECDAKLGDFRCGVNMNPPRWAPNTKWTADIAGDARFGAVIKPPVYNGLWYLCTGGSEVHTFYFPRGITYHGLGADPLAGSGFNPFNGFGAVWGLILAQWYFTQISQPSTAPGTPGAVAVTIQGGVTGTTEPVWPTSIGGTVSDGTLTWTAIPAKIVEGHCTGVISRTQFQDSTRTESAGLFQYGYLEWTSGENLGKQTEVRNFAPAPSGTFTLIEVMPNPIQVGDTYKVSWGCPKNREICRTRYDNLLNHRGFPDMPTEDRALTSPNFSAAQGLTFSEGGGGKK